MIRYNIVHVGYEYSYSYRTRRRAFFIPYFDATNGTLAGAEGNFAIESFNLVKDINNDPIMTRLLMLYKDQVEEHLRKSKNLIEGSCLRSNVSL